MIVPSVLPARTAVAAATLLLAGLACSTTTKGVASNPDAGSGGADGSAGSSAAGSSGSGGSAASGASDAPVDVGAPPCDPGELPGPGVFVAPDGSDTAGDGSSSLPVATIARGLDVAVATSRTRIYLAQGTYAEHVRFESTHEDVQVEGGWKRTGASWERDCSSGARSRTLIASPEAVGVHVSQLSRRSGLKTLSVATKSRGVSSSDSEGESLYGVVVTGPDTPFSLEDVAVQVGSGGDGGDATLDAPGQAAACTNLATGCGNGTVGSDSGDGEDAPLGTFDAVGYVPASGTPGMPGAAGSNGTQGQPGETGSCFPGGCTCTSPPCGTNGNRSPKSGGHGQCGCGGSGGHGGAAGRGGGASIGVLAVGANVIVSLSYVVVTAGNGGNGSAGRAGGGGMDGASSRAGGDEWCPEDCVVGSPGVNCVNDGCNQTGRSLAGGAAGGPGGKGGNGGRGGGGAGGPSYAVVSLEGASVLDDRSALVAGQPGAGGGSAPAGLVGERYTP